MSAFDLAELRRLSETNKPGPWGHSQSGYVFTGGGDAVCRTDVRDTDEDAGPLIAYLGTHRDRIVALLEAADALADAANAAMDGDSQLFGEDFAALWNACGDYEKAKGA